MTDDNAMYDWIKELEETGIYIVQNAPKPGTIADIGKKVAFLRNNTYGYNHHL